MHLLASGFCDLLCILHPIDLCLCFILVTHLHPTDSCVRFVLVTCLCSVDLCFCFIVVTCHPVDLCLCIVLVTCLYLFQENVYGLEYLGLMGCDAVLLAN